VLLLCSRAALKRKNLLMVATAHLAGIAVTTTADIVIKAMLHAYVYPNHPVASFAGRLRLYLFSQAEADIQIYILVAVIAYVLAYYAELRRQEGHAAELENSLIKAELQVLGTQLQPHFLFNTLHSVAALVTANPRAAQKMICSLGDLLRLTLAAGNVQEVQLEKELEFVQCYLDIQKLRFLDRLTVEIDVEDSLLDALVPYLVLQPMVENAIKYGVARCPGHGEVEIRAFREGSEICLSVANHGTSPYNPPPNPERHGIGLDNVRSRLRILYGTDARLDTLELPGGGFHVEIHLPCRRSIAPEPLPEIKTQILVSRAWEEL